MTGELTFGWRTRTAGYMARWIWLAKELVLHFIEGGSVSVCVWCLCSSQGRVAPGGHLGQ